MLPSLRVGLSFKLLTLVLGSLLFTVVLLASISIYFLRDALQSQAEQSLIAVRELKKQRIEEEMLFYKQQIRFLATDELTNRAMNGFNTSARFYLSEMEFTEAQTNLIHYEVRDYYHGPLLQRYQQQNNCQLCTRHTGALDIDSYFRELDDIGKALQHAFIVQNPHPFGEHHKLDRPEGFARYSAAHKRFHSTFLGYQQLFGYNDLLLINSEGRVVYSVNKSMDFGAFINRGPFAESQLSQAFTEMTQVTDPEAVRLIDLEPHMPALDAPAGFILAPIVVRGENIGVLAVELPLQNLNRLMTSEQRWRDVGQGRTGETYVVSANDLSLRSMPRPFLENPQDYLEEMQRQGLAWESLEMIRTKSQPIMYQRVKTPGVEAALLGKAGSATYPNYMSEEVVGAYAPLQIDGLQWLILSEITQKEINSFADRSIQAFTIFAILSALLVTGVGFVFTRLITKRIAKLTFGAKQLAQNKLEYRIYIDSGDELGDLSHSFNQMAGSIQGLLGNLRDVNENLEGLVRERTKDLNQALEAIEAKNDDLEEANEKIMDSIRYAQLIQKSLLPNREDFNKVLPQNFFMWWPRDVVSGDIYFLEKVKSYWILVVIDCTGHGVPGAFMTMIASSSIRRLFDQNCHDPAELLQQLNQYVKTTLQQDQEHGLSDDGMDVAVCRFDMKHRKLTYAGAKQPLFVLKDDAITTIKPDKQSVGYRKSDPNYTFTNHDFDLREIDSIYLATDGFPDQIGGAKGFPFGNRKFQRLLSSVSHLPHDAQMLRLEAEYMDYRGKFERKDDVTVVGIGFKK